MDGWRQHAVQQSVMLFSIPRPPHPFGTGAVMGALRHRTRENLIKCQQCGAWSVYGLGDPPTQGCARRCPNDGRGMCHQMRIMLLEHALRRAIIPDAYDERLRIKPGRLFDVLDAENDALRQVAALLGPMDTEFLPPPPART